MKIFCITGCVGTGKTTASSILRKKGYQVLDIDIMAKYIIKKYHIDKKLCLEYNTNIDDFKQLIFTNSHIRERLRGILYPRLFLSVFCEVIKLIFKGNDVIFLDIPLFFEIKLNYFFDSILIYCNRKTQMKRIKKRDGNKFKKEKIEIQIDIETKKRISTILIDNNGTKRNTKRQLDNLVFSDVSIYFYIFFLFSLFFSDL